MKLVKFALTPSVAAFSVALFAALSSFGGDSALYAGSDHLVAQWDGIDNFLDEGGSGNRSHDGSATVWSDLSGNGHDITGLTAYGSFASDMFRKTASSKNLSELKFGLTAKTFEVVVDVSAYSSGWIVPLSTTDSYFISLQKKDGKTLSMFFGSKNTKAPNCYGLKDVPWPEGDKILISCSTDGVIFLNGEKMSSNYTDYWSANGDNVFCGSSSSHGSTDVVGYGVSAIRLYDAVLSDEDRIRNAQIDRARFVDKATSDVLTVTATPESLGTVSPAYGTAPVEAGEVVCTAPTGEQTDSEDLRYTFPGWELTTKHLGIGDAVVTSGEGTTCRYVHAAGDVDTLCWKIVKTPLLNVKRVAQRYPWNGLVDIDYVVSGVTGTEVDYRLEVTAHAGGKDIPCRHFATDSAGDLPVADGLHHIVWDASKDAPDLKADDVTVTLDLQYAPVTETMADYIIIDLSAGPTAATYPVRFVKGDIPATAYNNPTYKTTKLVMKKVKSGVYTVGDNYLNSDGTTGELVKRSVVRLTHDYFLGIFEVTQRQYELVTGKKPSGCTIPNDKVAEDEIGMRPNEQVVWNNLAVNLPTFASLLNEKTRYRTHALANFSLPTETQWEIACRAGALTGYYWGKDETNAKDYEWYGDGQTPISRDHQTDVVGRRKPNGWGFYDMLGNVTEFCLDFNYVYPQGTEEEPAVDPRGPESGLSVIVRGSNFQSVLRNCGSRTDVAPNSGITYSGHMYGFRLAKTCP